MAIDINYTSVTYNTTGEQAYIQITPEQKITIRVTADTDAIYSIKGRMYETAPVGEFPSLTDISGNIWKTHTSTIDGLLLDITSLGTSGTITLEYSANILR